MKRKKKWLKFTFWLVLAHLVGAVIIVEGLVYLNDFQKDGAITLTGPQQTVTVTRDRKGMAYIHAQSLSDAIWAQGFVTAQDRLFSMQLTRLLAQGRICELAGAKALPLDIRMRTIGLHRLAKKQAAMLAPEYREFFQRYVEGVNAFIKYCPDDLPLEFKLAGIKAEPWTVADSLSVLYYMGFTSSANLNHEITAQMLVEKLGPQKAATLMPININPDDPGPARRAAAAPSALAPGLLADSSLLGFLGGMPLRLGSNNWALAPRLTGGKGAILAGDPHIKTDILPGVWYPLGIITPQVRAVGANIPGLPGMPIGRTQYVAIAMTNAYGDMQDLYLETLDPKNPERYLEGGVSKQFKVIRETLRIKDGDAPGGFREKTIRIRFTSRGPVVSGVFKGLGRDKVFTLRWAPAEAMGPVVGMNRFLTARSARDVDQAVKDVTMMALNWVFADSQGNIGYRASGRIPIRSQGDGTFPLAVADGKDNWTGWIPPDQMPHKFNPARGWLGTCNHKTTPRDYPYYYSSHCSPSYRYRRLIQLLDAPGPKPLKANWGFQRDDLNLMAQAVAPIMARALMAAKDTRRMGDILLKWKYHDDPDLAAPTVFQAVYLAFARQVFEDELGPRGAELMLNDWYFWQERLQAMVLAGQSPWFDDKRTADRVETRDQLMRRAGREAKAQLSKRLGDDPAEWKWGRVHTMQFVSPLRRHGLGKEWLGTGPLPMGGSGETLYRGIYDADKPFAVTIPASLRMVADLGDPDKVAAVIPGGVTGRQFSPHFKDQVEAYMDGRMLYWWFSDKAIAEHAEHKLALQPAK